MGEPHWEPDPWGDYRLTDGGRVLGYVIQERPDRWRSEPVGAWQKWHKTEAGARERVEKEARRGQA